MAGGEYLGFNNSIFLSERDTADRNFALAYFLRENNCFPPPSPDINIPDILDFYFQVEYFLINFLSLGSARLGLALLSLLFYNPSKISKEKVKKVSFASSGGAI